MLRRLVVFTHIIFLCLALPASPSHAGEKRSKKDQPAPSGFLGDYSSLEEGTEGGPLLVYVKEPGVLGSYDRFILNPVLVFFDPRVAGGGVDPEELKMLSDFLRDHTREQLEDSGYAVVTEPGPGVAVLRAAITNVEGVKTGRNVGLKAVGVAAGAGLLVPSVDVGHASIEVEILDSVSGDRLVAIVDAKKGRRFANLSKSTREFGDVKGAFKKWAKELRERLDEVHERLDGNQNDD